MSQEKAKLDRLREDDTNGGIREKKGRFKSKFSSTIIFL